jgi:hypothetical protein
MTQNEKDPIHWPRILISNGYKIPSFTIKKGEATPFLIVKQYY